MRRAIRRMGLALLLGLALSGPLAAGPLQDGNAAFAKGDYATALRLFRPLAEGGDPFAQFNLGFMYEDGKGVAPDFVQAATWYRKAADQGHAPAQYGLSGLYREGQGVAQDLVQSARWMRQAADQGNAEAQFAFSFHYFYGIGVPKDEAEAAAWVRKAADQGHAEAQHAVGNWYQQGAYGTPEDPVQAYKWYSLAVAQNESGAAKSRDKLARKMTPAQIAEAEKLARAWKPAPPGR